MSKFTYIEYILSGILSPANENDAIKMLQIVFTSFSLEPTSLEEKFNYQVFNVLIF